MTPELLKNVIEAALMASDSPRNLNQLAVLFENDPEKPDKEAMKDALARLAADYEGRGVELKEVASGYRFQVRRDFADWINRLYEDKPQRYSRAFLETLAIIAYRQPITRGEIEDIRGVTVSSNIIKSLQEREWIRVIGHRDIPGKPELLATTREFLDYFNLQKLTELPPLSELKDYDQLNPDLFDWTGSPAGEAAEPQEAAVSSPEETAAGVEQQVQDDNVVPFSG